MTTCDAGGEERLYVTASGIPGHILYFDGLEFLPTSTAGLHASLGDLIDEEADLGYRSVVCFKGRLWTAPAGSAVDADGSLHPVLLMNPDPAGGAAWETILDTTSHPVLGDPGNIGIFQLATVGDYLYLSVGNRDTGFELWQADGSACDAPPGACALGWTKIIDNGGGRPADGVSPLVDNAGATLGVFRDQLYVGPAESGYFELTLAELMRVREDGTWELLVGWPRVDFATIPNMHCPFPVDIPIDNDTDVDDCYPTSFRGPGFGGNPFQPGTVSYFWRFVEHEDSFFLGTLDLVDADLEGRPGQSPELRRAHPRLRTGARPRRRHGQSVHDPAGRRRGLGRHDGARRGDPPGGCGRWGPDRLRSGPGRPGSGRAGRRRLDRSAGRLGHRGVRVVRGNTRGTRR
jgi:hypothetical protein